MSITEQRSLLQILSDFEQTGADPQNKTSSADLPRQMDGYVRCTPVQPLRTDESFVQQRKHRIIRGILMVGLITLLIIAIIRSGIITI